MRLVVIGGGASGTYHARQLLAAGLDQGLVTVVDRDRGCLAFGSLEGLIEPVVADWMEFLRGWLPAADPADQLVPAPVAPHLLWEWLAGACGLERGAVPALGWDLPYEVAGASGELFLSAAAWTCPASCVEPAHCPVLHAPRDWDLAALIEERALALGYRPAVFRCVHFARGVGTVPVGLIQAAAASAAGLGEPGLLVATSSRCHAAVGVLRPNGSR